MKKSSIIFLWILARFACSRTRFNSAVLLSLVSPSELDATHLEFIAFTRFYRSFFWVNKETNEYHRPFWRLVAFLELLVECEVKFLPRAVPWFTKLQHLDHRTWNRSGADIRNLIVSWSLNYMPNHVSDFFFKNHQMMKIWTIHSSSSSSSHHLAVVAMDDSAGCADTIAVSPELVDPVDAEAVERSGGWKQFDFNRKKPDCLRVM